jgi:hypothetical protein
LEFYTFNSELKSKLPENEKTTDLNKPVCIEKYSYYTFEVNTDCTFEAKQMQFCVISNKLLGLTFPVASTKLWKGNATRGK